MKDFFIVLKFELLTMIKKKSFIISTVLVIAGAFLLIALPGLFQSDDSGNVGGGGSEGEVSEGEDPMIMLVVDAQHILDNEELLERHFPEYEVRTVSNLDALKQEINEDSADAGFEIHDDLHYTYYVKNSSLMDTTGDRFSALLQEQYQINECQKLGYDAAQIQQIYQTQISGEMRVLGTDGFSNYFYTYILIFILYMMILIYGNQIGVGVASEKSNRAIEILTTSCSPNALIFGKVIAGAIAGVIQTALMIGAVLVAYQINADSLHHVLDPYLQIPSSVLMTFAVFGILGYLLFSFIFGAIGASCSKVEEVNGATLPIQLMIIAVFMISVFTLSMPDSLLAQIMMYVPLSSWMCMFVNVAMGSVSTIQIVISLIILAATTLLMGWIGAKLYRRGTLSYGNTLKWKQLVHVLKHKGE